MPAIKGFLGFIEDLVLPMQAQLNKIEPTDKDRIDVIGFGDNNSAGIIEDFR